MMRKTVPAPEPLGILRGHGAPVNAVTALTVATIASGGADGVVKIWDLQTRREMASSQAHSRAGVLHVGRLDVRRLLTHGRDGYVRLWDVETFATAREPLAAWYCGSFTFTRAATMRWREQATSDAFDDLIVAPSADEKEIVVYDSREAATTPSMRIRANAPPTKRGMCMSLSLFRARSGGDPMVAAGWEAGQLSLLDLRGGGKLACEGQITDGTNPLLAFDITRDGSAAICGSSSEELSVATIDWAAHTISTKPFFKCNHGGISSIRLREDQRIFATAGWDHRVRIFHHRKLKPLAILKYHSESVFGVDFTPDSKFLVSASKDHKLALWSIYPSGAEQDHARANKCIEGAKG